MGDSFDNTTFGERLNTIPSIQSQLHDELQNQLQPLRDQLQIQLHNELQHQLQPLRDELQPLRDQLHGKLHDKLQRHLQPLRDELQPLRHQLQNQQQQLDSALQHLEKLTSILGKLAEAKGNQGQQEIIRPAYVPQVYSGYTNDHRSSNDLKVHPSAKIQRGSVSSNDPIHQSGATSYHGSNPITDPIHSSGSTEYSGSNPVNGQAMRSGSSLGLGLPGAVGPHYRYRQGAPQVEIQDIEYSPDPVSTHEVRMKMKKNSNISEV